MCFRSVNLLMANKGVVVVGQQMLEDALDAAWLELYASAVASKRAVVAGTFGYGCGVVHAVPIARERCKQDQPC